MRFIRNFWTVVEVLLPRLLAEPRVILAVLISQILTFLSLLAAVMLVFFWSRPLLGLLCYLLFVWRATRVGSDAGASTDAS